MKKENTLRKLIKTLFVNEPRVHLSWIESHATSVGAPDIQYCCDGVEGWIELKAGDDLEVRASQVSWMREHVRAGGNPLILIQISDMFLVVHGSRAKSLRMDSSPENLRKQASLVWQNKIDRKELMYVMRNPIYFRLTDSD